ncbi:MAG TPA: DUF1559 domain-containing protein [Armatimonadota bacterium]|jgi:prepilin-type N-terminal cleavage/methylation domain-containing protein
MRTRIIRAFTLIELLVVIAIIAILAAILFPVFAQAREKAAMAACASNMKQIGIGLYTYLNDYDECFPMNRYADASHPAGGTLDGSTRNWRGSLYPYVKSDGVMMCPSNPAAKRYPAVKEEGGVYPISYSYNGSVFHEFSNSPTGLKPVRLSQIKDPVNTIVLLESRVPNPDLGLWAVDYVYGTDPNKGWFQPHKGARLNWVMADTHSTSMKLVQTMTPTEMWHDTRWNQNDCTNYWAPRIKKEYR